MISFRKVIKSKKIELPDVVTKWHQIVTFTMVTVLLSSCIGGKKWPPNALLFTGTSLEIKKEGNKVSTVELKEQLKEIVEYPRSNRNFLGIRLNVWIYQHTKPGSWIQRKFGSKPVLYSEQETDKTATLMLKKTAQMGWLDVTLEKKVKQHRERPKAKVKYIVHLKGNPYKINRLQWLEGEDALSTYLNIQSDLRQKAAAHAYYRIDQWVEVRDELTSRARNAGFYNFSPDYLYFKADSNRTAKTIDISVALRNQMPAQALLPCTIKEVHVFTNFNPSEPIPQKVFNTSDGTFFYNREEDFHLNTYAKAITIHPGDLYSETSTKNTIEQLNNLNIYANIQVKYESLDTLGQLRANVLLTPSKRNKVEIYANAIGSPQLYVGGEASVSYQRKNIMNRATSFHIKSTYSHLWIQDRNLGNFLQSFNLNAGISQPYFVKRRTQSKRNPLLSFETTGNYRIDYLEIPTDVPTFPNFGIRIKEWNIAAGISKKARQHSYWTQEIRPLVLNYQSTAISPRILQEELLKDLNSDTSLLFIAPRLDYAPFFSTSYNNRFAENIQTPLFFRQFIRFKYGKFLLPDSTITNLNLSSILQLTYESNFQINRKLSKRLLFAGRFIGNIAMPLGDTPPESFGFNELYTVGGSNGLRSFSPSSIGPGAFPADSSVNNLGFYSKTGNLLLQTNLEMRYKIKNWETVLFTDIGNIWNTYTSGDYQDAEFRISGFHKQLGIGSGLGLRYYFSLIILRLDVGFVIHNPSLRYGSRWQNPLQGKQIPRLVFTVGQAF